MTEYALGHVITVSPIPKELTYFSLAKEFGWLPDEIDRQNPRKLKGVIHVLSFYNDVKNKEMERENRSRSRGAAGGAGKHYIDITDPEIEQQLEQKKLKI